MLRRLAKMTVQTGAATTFFALATLAVFLQNHRYNGKCLTHTSRLTVADTDTSGGCDELLSRAHLYAHQCAPVPHA
jgi:hypothetical protein